jgi:hypothetical protein
MKRKDSRRKNAMRKLWLIESPERTYHTGCFETQKEAIYRLNEMAVDAFYLSGATITRRARDFFALSDGATFRVVDWHNQDLA